MNILIVEDETALAEAVEHILRKAGHSADRVADGQSALDYIRVGGYDLILLDIMLPRLDGISVLRKLRSEGVQTPVLMLTARTTVPDKVAGLNAGADDYLTKPFGILELISRVRALLRRTHRTNHPAAALFFGPISIDDSTHTAAVNGKPVELTFKEYALLELLLAQAGKVVTREEIFSRVWNMDTEIESRTLDMHIRTLRQKLGNCGRLIETVRNVGYRLEATP